MNASLKNFLCRLRTSHALQLLAVTLVLTLCFGIWSGISYLTDPYGCRILDGVAIDGVDLSGMTRWQARKVLKDAARETLLSQPLTVTLPKEALILDPKELKLRLDVSQAVKDAYSIGRGDTGSAAVNSGLSVYLSCDETLLFDKLMAYAARYDTELLQPEYRMEGMLPDLTENGFDADASCPALMLTLGTPECHLDTGTAKMRIMELYGQGISACNSGSYVLILEDEPEQLPENPDVDALYEQYAREAENAVPDLKTYEIIPASYGLVFDREEAQAAIGAAAYGETITIPMTYQSPEILSDTVYFRDVLGTCETRHTDDENRNTNLRLVCQILDGYVLQPGEEFSYNGVIGERTEERGFKPAGAYSGTRLVKDIGGGVCQGSSTLYNCVLLADLEVTERVCHGLLVNYLPIGMDAAVNWATKTDFKFRNNFHFPIMLKAEVSDGYMKMKILGTDEKDYYVEMRSGRSDEEFRIYSNSYKYKYDKVTGELISKDLEARSSYMYFTS